MIQKIIKIGVLVVLLGVFAWTIYFLYAKSAQPPVGSLLLQESANKK